MIVPSPLEFESAVQIVKNQAPPPALCHVVHISKVLLNVLDNGCKNLVAAKTQEETKIVLMTFLIAGMMIQDFLTSPKGKAN